MGQTSIDHWDTSIVGNRREQRVQDFWRGISYRSPVGGVGLAVGGNSRLHHVSAEPAEVHSHCQYVLYERLRGSRDDNLQKIHIFSLLCSCGSSNVSHDFWCSSLKVLTSKNLMLNLKSFRPLGMASRFEAYQYHCWYNASSTSELYYNFIFTMI